MAAPPMRDESVEAIKVKGARQLVTVTLDGPVMHPLDGAIVRVIPAQGIGPEEKARIARSLRERGAAHVWFAPPSAGARVVLDESVASSVARRETAREAVMAMFKEAASRDPVRLAAVLEKALARAGL